MIRRVVLLAGLCALGQAALISAHEMRPGYLELRQSDETSWEVFWKVPARGDLRLALDVQLPESCLPLTPVSSYPGGGAITQRWLVRCPKGLEGESISILGLETTLTDVLARIERADGTTQVARLSPSAPAFVVEATPGVAQVATTYLRLGVEHIFAGVDHLLFIACLLLLARTWRRVLVTITGFTAAHSLTLALSTLDVVHLPVPPVEAAIALSIVFLAIEIFRGKTASLTHRYPIAVSGSFGLLHGFGFAAVLREIGLPQTALPAALLFFNVGVEIGQVLFVLALGGVLLVVRRLTKLEKRDGFGAAAAITWLERPACYAIGAVASYWLIDRVTAFWA